VFRWVDHTGELELEIEASTEEGVFVDALAALAELLASEQEGEPGVESESEPGLRRRVSVEAEDRPVLLAAWMEELLFLAENEGFEPLAVETLELGPRSARATVKGGLGHPPPLVKAVTYHRLSFAPADDGYRATVVLDV
jgi:SHS2 domain-containing protein